MSAITTQAVIYLHGFNSSPQSEKATLTQNYLRQHYPDCIFRVPQLPSLPNEAISFLHAYVEALSNELSIPADHICLLGSSLGGYYAIYLANCYRQKSLLVNPAIYPYLLLSDYLGEQCNPYTGERYHLQEHHMQVLRDIEVAQDALVFERYTLLLESADEVLNYRDAVSRFHKSRLWIEYGGDHRCISYVSWLPEITHWFFAKR